MTRKRDDLEEGALYRVVQRVKDSDEEWQHSSYGHYGAPRTYMTIGAARGMRTRMVRTQEDARAYRPQIVELEFAVQRAPVTNWEVVPD